MWHILDLILVIYTTYSLHTNHKYIIFNLNPYHIVHPSENFKIQENKTIKVTYVPNTIRISTHEVDLWHHELGFGEKTPNRQWSHHKMKREEMRRKERRKKEISCPILCRSHADPYDVTNV
jgi:hypothetical protein